jgi:hypothetical protein
VYIHASTSAVVDSSDIYDNGGTGMVNPVSSPMIDARYCWWGHESGPYDPTDGNPDYNPDGQGDEVSDWIIYRPWLTSPVTNLPPGTFAPLEPAEGDTVHLESITFIWGTSVDPDGDPVTYSLEVDTVATFPAPELIVAVSGLTDTTYTAVGPFTPNMAYYWRVAAEDGAGGVRMSTPPYIAFFTGPYLMSVADDLVEREGAEGQESGAERDSESRAFHVGRVVPNPFRARSQLEFSLPRAEAVKVEIWDVQGRRVRTLLDAQLPGGHHEAHWDGVNEKGIPVASGVFFYRVTAQSGSHVRRVILVR